MISGGYATSEAYWPGVGLLEAREAMVERLRAGDYPTAEEVAAFAELVGGARAAFLAETDPVLVAAGRAVLQRPQHVEDLLRLLDAVPVDADAKGRAAR